MGRVGRVGWQMLHSPGQEAHERAQYRNISMGRGRRQHKEVGVSEHQAYNSLCMHP